VERRISVLLVVAVIGGLAAVATADGTKALVAVPRLPALAPRPIAAANHCPIPAVYRHAFQSAARETGFQLAMLVAVAEEESRFQPAALSTAGARGLLQLMPATAASLKLDPDNPTSNVLAGARYLKLLLDRYRSTDLALAAYNAGPTAVDRAGGAPSSETMTYVANVQDRWRALAGCA
jgi:soluble lytic murein transglycosylase-like protein